MAFGDFLREPKPVPLSDKEKEEKAAKEKAALTLELKKGIQSKMGRTVEFISPPVKNEAGEETGVSPLKKEIDEWMRSRGDKENPDRFDVLRKKQYKFIEEVTLPLIESIVQYRLMMKAQDKTPDWNELDREINGKPANVPEDMAHWRVVSKALEPYMRFRQVRVRDHCLRAIEIAFQQFPALQELVEKKHGPLTIQNFDKILGALPQELFQEVNGKPDVKTRVSEELGKARGLLNDTRKLETLTGLTELVQQKNINPKNSGGVLNVIGEENGWEDLINRVNTLFDKDYRPSRREQAVSDMGMSGK